MNVTVSPTAAMTWSGVNESVLFNPMVTAWSTAKATGTIARSKALAKSMLDELRRMYGLKKHISLD